MSPIYILSSLISIGLIIHCLKTHRRPVWIFLILFLPFIGALAYFAIELLPELMTSRSGRRTMRGIKGALNPEGDLRRLEIEMKVSGNIHARQRYAEELVRLGRAKEAVEVYRTSLTGLFAEDPKLLLGYAQAQFAADDAAGARQTLDTLIDKNPDFKSPDGHLLYARALEAEGNLEKALSEYATLASYYAGAEAGVRYAKLLKRSGKGPQARQILESLLESAKYAPAHYRRAQREWLDEAAAELRSG